MRNKKTQVNIDNSNEPDYPDGRIKNNTGGGNGTPVNEAVYGDIHEFFAKLMRLYGIPFNGLPDNETNGYQSIEALRSLATKNDFLIKITSSSSSQLSIPLKLGKIINEEIFKASSTIDISSSTFQTIKGSDNTARPLTVFGNVKSGEIVTLVSDVNGIYIIRDVSARNIDSVNSDLGFLKAATSTQVEQGSVNNVAVTPGYNRTAFINRVIGSTSGSYLASATRNGLLSATQWNIINNLSSGAEERYGFFQPFDLKSTTPVGSQVVTSGQISTASVSNNTTNGEEYLVTISPSMPSSKYTVNIMIEGLGSRDSDNELKVPIYRVVNSSQFVVYLEELSGATQSLRVHCEIKAR